MAYLKVAKDSKYSFLLESVISGENVARYSFIGSGQFLLSITREKCASSHGNDPMTQTPSK
jgi:anthranilate synthase component 1